MRRMLSKHIITYCRINLSANARLTENSSGWPHRLTARCKVINTMHDVIYTARDVSAVALSVRVRNEL